MPSKFLNRKEAARYAAEERGAPVTAKTLAKMACLGGGPLYQIFGNTALYTKENLDAWIDGKLSPLRASTSEIVEEDAA